MSQVGSLVIRLQAETAQLRGDLGKVTKDLNDLKGGAQAAGDGIDFSMAKARGSMMLVEAATGVRLPRALNSLIATIPGVGAAFAVMLPLAGVVAAIAVIGKLIEIHEKQVIALRHATDEAIVATVKEEDQARALELTNLKLDDQIAKLEHKPSHNYMKEAMIETALEVDKLAATYAADFEKMNGSLEEHLGWWDTLKKTAWDAASAGIANAIAYAAVQRTEFQSLQDKMAAVNKSREALSSAPVSDAAQRAGIADLIQKLKAQKLALDNAAGATGNDKAMLLSLTSAAASTANEIKNLNAEVEAGAKRKTVAGLEQGTANLEPIKNEAALFKIVQGEAAKASEALKAHLDAVARLSEMKNEGDGNDPAKKYEAQHEYNSQVYADALDNAARLKQIAADLYAKEYAANADNKIKQTELEKSYAAEIAGINRSQATALDELNQKTLADWLAAEEKKRQLAVEISKSVASLAEATAKREETAAEDGLKKQESAITKAHALGLASERQYIAAKIALTRQEQAIKTQAINAEIAAQQKAADVAGAAGNLAAQNEALAKRVQLQAQLNTLTATFNTEVSAQITDAAKLNSTWANYFGKMKVETQDLSTQIRTKLQASVDQFTTSFGNSMAQCIVENKSLGQAVRQTAGQMLESMISMLIQWLEKWIITHTLARVFSATTDKSAQISAAGLAGANMTASWAAAPWPIDAEAPAMGAMAAAAAMSFEVGGKIPGSGPVPITGHGGETVVTKALTDRVEQSERGGRGGNMHMHFSPQIHALDAEGVDRVLTKHASTFERHFRQTVRKMNR